MKAFLYATLLFLLITVASFANDLHLAHLAGEMQKDAALLSAEAADSARFSDLVAKWEEERMAFTISTHYNELEALESAITRAKAAQEKKSDSDYYIAVAEIADSFSRLKELNEISTFGLL